MRNENNENVESYSSEITRTIKVVKIYRKLYKEANIDNKFKAYKLFVKYSNKLDSLMAGLYTFPSKSNELGNRLKQLEYRFAYAKDKTLKKHIELQIHEVKTELSINLLREEYQIVA